MYYNYHSTETEKYIKEHYLFSERWKRNNNKSNYKTNNNIFDSNVNTKDVKDAKYYKNKVKADAEENIERSQRVFSFKIIFIGYITLHVWKKK